MKLVKTIYIKAPREHVWKFLTKADQLALWFHRGRRDLAEGGDYILETNSFGREGEKLAWGRVLEMKEPEKLVHTFTHNYLKGVETTCAWLLEQVEGGTIVTLTHEGFEKLAEDAFAITAEHDKGWDQHFVRLRQVAG
ncbi:MAG: SRPBCC domain-containing protein [Alphaproteobacteria bacterium]|nr:SRPBCC domain-containing protein [Alphaproteobacteria bacterium]